MTWLNDLEVTLPPVKGWWQEVKWWLKGHLPFTFTLETDESDALFRDWRDHLFECWVESYWTMTLLWRVVKKVISHSRSSFCLKLKQCLLDFNLPLSFPFDSKSYCDISSNQVVKSSSSLIGRYSSWNWSKGCFLFLCRRGRWWFRSILTGLVFDKTHRVKVLTCFFLNSLRRHAFRKSSWQHNVFRMKISYSSTFLLMVFVLAHWRRV